MKEDANTRLEMAVSWSRFGQAGHSPEKQSPETCWHTCTGPIERHSYCHGPGGGGGKGGSKVFDFAL